MSYKRCNLKEIGGFKVVAKENVVRQNRMMVCRMTLETNRRKIVKADPGIK